MVKSKFQGHQPVNKIAATAPTTIQRPSGRFFIEASMLKRFFLALAFAGLLSPAYPAGTVPGYGPSQQLDNLGKPLANCFLYTIQAGTVSTPQNAYQDSGLTLVL